MIRYLIIDDEYIAHTVIEEYCNMLPNMQLKKNCYDAIEALDYLRDHPVDLIFLDLNMPKLKGFDFLKTLTSPPKIIVTTAYQEYAIEGYELNIIDYLLKPYSFERFLKAINKSFSKPVSQVVIQPETAAISRQIFLQSERKYVQVEINTILYIEAAGNYTKIITTTEVINIREKISTVIESLPKDDFLQVHKSFAVAPKHISSIEGNRIFIIDHIIPIGKIFRANVIQLLK